MVGTSATWRHAAFAPDNGWKSAAFTAIFQSMAGRRTWAALFAAVVLLVCACADEPGAFGQRPSADAMMDAKVPPVVFYGKGCAR
jgi:hypothetical protein